MFELLSSSGCANCIGRWFSPVTCSPSSHSVVTTTHASLNYVILQLPAPYCLTSFPALTKTGIRFNNYHSAEVLEINQ